MKRRLIASLFLVLLTMSFISAINFEIKDEYKQEEILIGKLSGDFVKPPVKENIVLYRGHVRSPLNIDLAKFGQDYYFYAPLAGKTANNYSLVIENIEYKENTKTIKEDLIKNFTIINETASFILDKGFVNTKDDFFIELENLRDEDLKIDFEITTISGDEGGIANYDEDENNEITINPGKERINFEIGLNNGQTTKLIEFSSGDLKYKIPVSIFVDDFSEQNKLYAFKIQPEEIELEVPTTGDPINRLIYIYNTGTGTLTDVKLRLSDSLKPYVIISDSTFGRILPGSNANLNLTITPSSEKSIAGELLVQTEQSLVNSIRVAITFKKGAEVEVIPELTTNDNCADIGGQVCLESEVCKNTDEIIYANDGVCCIAGCQTQTSSSAGKIIGILLILGIIGFGIWFFLVKYKKTGKKTIDLLKIARGKK